MWGQFTCNGSNVARPCYCRSKFVTCSSECSIRLSFPVEWHSCYASWSTNSSHSTRSSGSEYYCFNYIYIHILMSTLWLQVLAHPSFHRIHPHSVTLPHWKGLPTFFGPTTWWVGRHLDHLFHNSPSSFCLGIPWQSHLYKTHLWMVWFTCSLQTKLVLSSH